jgi:hypothetical protein
MPLQLRPIGEIRRWGENRKMGRWGNREMGRKNQER